MTDQQFYAVLNKSMPDYTPVEKIGAGSFGSVFKCERDNIYYAIKIIPVPPNEDELRMLLTRSDEEEVREYLGQKVENYRREIKLMAELKGNRNIVNIEDYKVVEAEESLGYYIVIRMELLTSLTSFTSKHKLTRDEIIRLGIDICDALIICEKHNVIHRDIKPENIMIHNDGAYKLGDFGVAKQLSKTTMGTIAGTEGFMAPEVSRGQEYNHTADIYSLGILLYYFLNNRKMPYVDPNNKSITAEEEAIVKRMSTDEILPFPPNTDENLSKIVVKACMYHKNLRYQSAEEMQMDLIMVLHGKNVNIDLEALSEPGLHAEDEKGTSEGGEDPFGGSIYIPPNKGGDSGGPKKTEEIPKEKPKKKGALIAGVVAAVVVLGAAGAGIGYVMQNQPASNIEVQENTVRELTRSEMEEAYTLGLQYYQLGNYENAVAELNKVTKKSGKYEDAQATMVVAKTAYKDELIEKSSAYCASGNYEMALSLLESGTSIIGGNTDIAAQRQDILNKLKVDHIKKATEAEESNEYVKAFSYIQTAAAYLPDDVELQGLYARLDAMSTAEAAIRDAENYYAAEEYAKLFTVLADAMSDVSDSATASSKVKLKYDEYKKIFLKDVEVKIKNPTTVEEYSRAIDALNVAVTIFPQEYELKTKHESLKLMKVALDGIIQADQYKLEGEDAKMFAALMEAQDAVYADEEAYNKVADVYDTYKNEYMENLNYQIGEPVSVSEYENAIQLLEEAVATLPGEYTLQSRLMEYKQNKPINMLDREPVSVYCYVGYSGYSEKRSISDDAFEHYFSTDLEVTDNYSNSYQNATMLKVGSEKDSSAANTNTPCDTRVVYDCEGYTSLTGTIAIVNEYKNYAGQAAVRINGIGADNERTVLYTFNLNNGSKPQQISIDISDYASVSIELLVYSKIKDKTYIYGYYRGEIMGIILSDFTLSK